VTLNLAETSVQKSRPSVPYGANLSVYYVGEERIDIRSPLVHAGIVTEGVPLTSNEMLSVILVSQVLGTQPVVEYSPTQPSSKLYSAASIAIPDRNFAVCTTIW